MSEEIKDQEIRKAAVPSGLILGLVVLVLGIFSFYFMTGMTTSMIMMLFSPLIFSIIVPLVVAIFFIIDLRKKVGGYWTFKQATSGIFIMFLIAVILSTIGNYGFGKFIEPNMVEKTKVAMVDAVTTVMEKSNAAQADIDKAIDDMEKKFDEQENMTIGTFVKNFGITLIVLFIVSLIFGAIFKKARPVFLADDQVDPTV